MDKSKELRCQNCGAAYTDQNQSYCEYCGSLIKTKPLNTQQKTDEVRISKKEYNSYKSRKTSERILVSALTSVFKTLIKGTGRIVFVIVAGIMTISILNNNSEFGLGNFYNLITQSGNYDATKLEDLEALKETLVEEIGTKTPIRVIHISADDTIPSYLSIYSVTSLDLSTKTIYYHTKTFKSKDASLSNEALIGEVGGYITIDNFNPTEIYNNFESIKSKLNIQDDEIYLNNISYFGESPSEYQFKILYKDANDAQNKLDQGDDVYYELSFIAYSDGSIAKLSDRVDTLTCKNRDCTRNDISVPWPDIEGVK